MKDFDPVSKHFLWVNYSQVRCSPLKSGQVRSLYNQSLHYTGHAKLLRESCSLNSCCREDRRLVGLHRWSTWWNWRDCQITLFSLIQTFRFFLLTWLPNHPRNSRTCYAGGHWKSVLPQNSILTFLNHKNASWPNKSRDENQMWRVWPRTQKFSTREEASFALGSHN